MCIIKVVYLSPSQCHYVSHHNHCHHPNHHLYHILTNYLGLGLSANLFTNHIESQHQNISISSFEIIASIRTLRFRIRMSASPRHDKSPNDNVDDEIQEGLKAFPVSVEAESENNNF